MPAQADWLEVLQISNFNFGTWSFSGNLRMDQTHCLASADTPRKSGWTAKDRRLPYSITVASSNEPTTFTLFKDGIRVTDVSQRLPVRIYHEDVLGGGGREELLPSVQEKHVHTGQFFSCPSGNNSRISIELASSHLQNVKPGVYTETFSLLTVNTDKSQTIFFTVSVTVNNGGQVRISRLNSVAFGSHDGSGNISKREAFCVQSSALNGGYRLSVTAARGSGGEFTMVPDIGGNSIPLTLGFASGSVAPTTITPSQSVSGTGSANTDCNGTDNAYLDLSLREADLQAADSGRYTQTLILLVEPL